MVRLAIRNRLTTLDPLGGEEAVTITIASWYVVALMHASIHIDEMFQLIGMAILFVGRMVRLALITLFGAVGVSHFLT